MPNTNCNPGLNRYLRRENKKVVDTLRAAIKDRAVREEDYPRVAIACEYSNHQAYGHSLKCHSSIQTPVNYVHPLLQALRVFGEPPIPMRDAATGKTLYIGSCAEDSAANQVMEKTHISTGHYPRLKSLVFTKPVRARNYQRRDFCDVCNAIF